MEEIGAAYGIGRDMHVGDTIIGIKGRVGFEAAAPMLIIGAHRFLEKYTLSKWQQYWKDQVANWYGMFLHESQYLEPVMRDIEAMLQESQRNVNGTAILELRPLSFSTVGVESQDDLVKTKFGEYGEMQKGWSGGFESDTSFDTDDSITYMHITANTVSSTYLFHFLDGGNFIFEHFSIHGVKFTILKFKAQKFTSLFRYLLQVGRFGQSLCTV